MASFLLYIIQSGCCLTFFYLGYKFLLSHETFFHFNRKILLTGMLVCLLLPFIKIKTETIGFIQQPMIQLEKIMIEEEQNHLFSISNETNSTPVPVGKPLPPISPVHLLAIIFVIGAFVQLCLLIRAHISLGILLRKGRKIKQGGYTIVLFDKPILPFNYGHYIVLSAKDYNEYQETIFTHELAHFRFSHTVDIIFVEILSIFQWFNPFVRLLKNEIQKIHEFQADAAVLNTGIDATKYQLLLMKKAVDSGPYTFANSFNHSKLKIRITMMLKKRSNSWARLKFLLLLPVAALSVYAFGVPGMNRQIEQIMRNEDTTISSNNTNFTPEFFETELNKYISGLGGSVNLPVDEKMKFLTDKTNIVRLFVNARDQILLDGAYCTIERLQSDLSKILIADFPNKKPALIYMQVDRGTSPEAITEILNIAGKIFEDNEALFKQKKQPVLLLFGLPKQYSTPRQTSTTASENHPLAIAFMDKAGKELRSFAFETKNPINRSFDFDNADTIHELKEWLKNHDKLVHTVSIQASPETPMGIITDLKQALREIYALKYEYKVN